MERFRRAMRRLLGWNSKPYRFASRLASDAAILLREGPGTLRKINELRKGPRSDTWVAVTFRHLQHPFVLRPGTRDVGTAVSNFVREEYGQIRFDEPPRTLIDAGAYIGDTTAYFLSRFPQLQAIAVEPNPESLELARRNLAPYENRVTLLPVALAATETPVRIAGTETGAQISSQGVEVEATTIVKLLDGLPNGRASIVKMDIEGAEREVFAASPETWLPRIDHIIVETHGPDIARDVLAALGRNGWRAVRYRNLYYCQPAGQYSPRESGGDSASR